MLRQHALLARQRQRRFVPRIGSPQLQACAVGRVDGIVGGETIWRPSRDVDHVHVLSEEGILTLGRGKVVLHHLPRRRESPVLAQTQDVGTRESGWLAQQGLEQRLILGLGTQRSVTAAHGLVDLACQIAAVTRKEVSHYDDPGLERVPELLLVQRVGHGVFQSRRRESVRRCGTADSSCRASSDSAPSSNEPLSASASASSWRRSRTMTCGGALPSRTFAGRRAMHPGPSGDLEYPAWRKAPRPTVETPAPHGGVSHTAARSATAGPAIRRGDVRPLPDAAIAPEPMSARMHTRLPQTRMRAAARTVAFVLLLRQSA